jgi:hypothetical protein
MPGFLAELPKLIETARQQWQSWSGLVLAEVIGIAVTLALGAEVSAPPYAMLVLSSVVMAGVGAAWGVPRRLPRTRNGKVGFVISIAAGSGTDPSRIREDFVVTLHELVTRGASGQWFQVIEIPQRVAERVVDVDAARDLLRRCRGHFVVYGRVRSKDVGAKTEHILHLSVVVRHGPIAAETSSGLSAEISHVMPGRVRIAGDDDELGFFFTAEWLDCVARYVIGLAAALSGDLDYSEKLFDDVRVLLRRNAQPEPVRARLAHMVPLRLLEIRLNRALHACRRWSRTHDPADMDSVGHHLEGIPPQHASMYPVALLRSIFAFVHDHNIRAAKAALRKCRNEDANRLYGLAFLEAYSGDLASATRRYRGAARYHVEPAAISEIEEFIEWVLENEPERYQLHYCLGFINWHVKGDAVRSRDSFAAFLSKGEEDRFVDERQLARTWMAESERGSGGPANSGSCDRHTSVA